MHDRGSRLAPRSGALAVLLALVFVASLALPAAGRSVVTSPAVATGFTVHSEFRPDDPLYGLQWGPAMIGAEKAWDVTWGSHNVTVAVVDTGVWYTDTDIGQNMWRNPDPLHLGTHGYDYIDGDYYPMDGDVGTYHGTGVAGVIGAVMNNGTAIAGVSQGSIMAVRALGPNGEGTSANTSKAIRWAADNGARIINLSLGTNNTFIGPTDISLAIDYAWSKDALIIAAAGNGVQGVGQPTLDYPASLPNVVSVAAVDQSGVRAGFSNYGTGLSISAPGTSILTLSANNQVHNLDGTSLATPFVSAVAALALSMDPGLTNVQLWNLLNETAAPVGSRYNTQYGWGIVDAWNAIYALNRTFISVNSPPTTVSRSSSFSVGWSILSPPGRPVLPVTDTHVVWGTDKNRLGNATQAQTGFTRQNYTAAGLAIPGSADTLWFKVVATVNGTLYESEPYPVTASNLPDFLFVLINLLSSNLLYLALFILALAAIVAFVPSRRSRRARAQYRARAYGQSPQVYAPPPSGPPPAASRPVQSHAEPPAVEFVKPAATPPPAVAAPPPVAAKKRCPNCGTLVNSDNLFCFFCGRPFR